MEMQMNRNNLDEDSSKKELIKEIAFDLFLNRGYEATTIRMICSAAKVEAPTLYYYFDSKMGLFLSIVNDFLADYQIGLQGFMNNQSRDPLEKLFKFYTFAINYCIHNHERTKFYLRYRLFRPIELMDAVGRHMEHTDLQKKEFLLEHIREGIDKGIILEPEDITYQRIINFIDSCTFNIIFSHWRPDETELKLTWDLFFANRIGRSAL